MDKLISQSGQTLIETMVAAFVLIMGISAAVGLSIYSLNSMRNIPKQIIGAGLAREGIEAVKNMRDTNWLQDTLSVGGCYDFYAPSVSGGNCYPNWLTVKYGINPEGQKTYSLSFNPGSTATPWLINSTATNFGLNRITDNGTGLSYYGYNNTPMPVSLANSGFARKITLSTDITTPFDNLYYQRLKVRVDVWWTNKTCPTLSSDVPTQNSCKITLETYLTNWRNY